MSEERKSRRSKVFKSAWQIYREEQKHGQPFGLSLMIAWSVAKRNNY